MSTIEQLESYKAWLVEVLMNANGPLLHGDVLRHLLGFASGGAMRSALARELLPITLMEFPYRQGKFALTEEVVMWLFYQRNKNASGLSSVGAMYNVLSDKKLNDYLQQYDFLLHEAKIIALLKIDTRKELLNLFKKKSLPFVVFQLDNRRTKMFALLTDVIPYIESVS